ncbi:MAG: protein translocase subunit SecD [Micrococcales bacterium]|nr:protein translocase subunit SecD [Micrococcales bacterium]
MANAKTRPHRRALVYMLLICLLLGGMLGAVAQWRGGQWTPKLGLDLEGGTQMILQPQVAAGSSVNTEQLAQAVDIMRARVDGQGVSEAEVATLGDNVVVSVPGRMNKEQEDALRQSSQMRFRPVITALSAQPQAVPTPAATPGAGTATKAPTGTATPKASPKTPATQAPTPKASASTAGAVLPQSLRQGAPAARGSLPAATSAPATPAATSPPKPAAAATPTPGVSQGPGIGLPTGASASKDGTPTISDADAKDPKKLVEYATSEAWLTPAWQEKLANYDCRKQPVYDPTKEDLRQPSISCSDDGSTMYLLGPAVISGADLADASSGPSTNQQGQPTGGYQVNLQMRGGDPTAAYAAISAYMVPLPEPRNQLAVVLDNKVVSAPRFESAIPNGQAQITGNFTSDSAKALADQLKFGALPMSFQVQSTEQVSPTIGGGQLRLGIIAGLIGLALVVAYSLLQYRALGFVTVASLLIVALLTYLCLTLFGWAYNLRLTMAGVTGAIVAIGTTADSFIVYFERVRDEVREGRRLQSAVQTGWDRARRTILVSDGVNFLAAAVLYVLASSNVRGFAFMLMLTTILDVLVTFLFTHPLLSILSHTKFFGEGHKWSGFDRATLGAQPRYRGRGRVTIADRKHADATPAAAGATAEGSRA